MKVVIHSLTPQSRSARHVLLGRSDRVGRIMDREKQLKRKSALMGRSGEESVVSGFKANTFSGWLRWLHEIADGLEDGAETGVILVFERGDLAGEALNGQRHAAELHEGLHQRDTGMNRLGTVQDVGGHQGAMLGKGVGQITTPATAL